MALDQALAAAPAARTSDRAAELEARLFATRELSATLAAPLSEEDMVVQPMDDASPAKWHLAHTTWFFEAFLLRPWDRSYRIFAPDFEYCFNSYYESVGPRHPRPRRGLLTRPGAGQVRAYRAHVDEGLARLTARGDLPEDVLDLIELGINHEQQHQELLLTDILALFAAQPLKPAYKPGAAEASPTPPAAPGWCGFDGGIFEVGHDGRGFAYDNEGPRHEALVRPFELADRLVTNAEWLDFMADGGYATPTLWLADGWSAVQTEGWRAPLYWEETADGWAQMSLSGLRPVEPAAPVTHVSYYEAEAFARWIGKRLPTEFEWEVAAGNLKEEGRTLGAGALRPLPAEAGGRGPRQMYGDVWEWTQSAYSPYPGYRPVPGAVGEYNGKFMCGQYVLKGGSCATPDDHVRRSYRNFFYPHQRWQFLGLRLADDV